MPRLTDPDVLALFRETLQNWRWRGFIEWKRVAAEWLANNLQPHTQAKIGQLMYEHVRSGGEIDQVKETREEYLAFEYHYDFRIQIGDRLIYIETILTQSRMGPTLNVVSIHDV